MDADEWRKKRETLLGQLRDLEAGRVSHWHEVGSGELKRTTTDESVENDLRANRARKLANCTVAGEVRESGCQFRKQNIRIPSS